jgi:hypothetical protein
LVFSFQTLSIRLSPLLAGAAPPETDCRRKEKLGVVVVVVVVVVVGLGWVGVVQG